MAMPIQVRHPLDGGLQKFAPALAGVARRHRFRDTTRAIGRSLSHVGAIAHCASATELGANATVE